MMLRAAADREQRPYALQLGQSCFMGPKSPSMFPAVSPCLRPHRETA